MTVAVTGARTRTRTRTSRILTVVAVAAAVAGLPLPAATAAEGGLLRLAHLSPDTPAVDVYVESVADPAVEQVFPGVGYGTVSDYQAVPAGTYAISMRAAGADAASPPVLSSTVEVGPDTARTVAGVGPFADLGLEVLEDDLTPPAAGSSRLRVIAAASTAPRVDVAVPGGGAVATDVAFADTTGYVDVPAGTTSITVTPAGGQPTELPVEVQGGSVYSVLVLDRPGGGLTVQAVLDAAGPGVVPSGGVEAGAGGTAGAAGPSLPVVLTAVGGSLVAGAGLVAAAARHTAARSRRAAPARTR